MQLLNPAPYQINLIVIHLNPNIKYTFLWNVVEKKSEKPSISFLIDKVLSSRHFSMYGGLYGRLADESQEIGKRLGPPSPPSIGQETTKPPHHPPTTMGRRRHEAESLPHNCLPHRIYFEIKSFNSPLETESPWSKKFSVICMPV